jgi:pilus assembly protein Flp/PilA
MNKLFHSLHQKFSSFIRREDGASAIEYAIIAGLIAVAIIAGARIIGEDIGEVFTEISGALQEVEVGGGG